MLMFSEKCPSDDLGNLAGWSCCFVGMARNVGNISDKTLVCIGKLCHLQLVKMQLGGHIPEAPGEPAALASHQGSSFCMLKERKRARET